MMKVFHNHKGREKWNKNDGIMRNLQVYPSFKDGCVMASGDLKGITRQRLCTRARGAGSHRGGKSTRVPWMITAMTSRITEILPPSLVPWKIWKSVT